ncbi:MAG: FMN-dependent NADH-azoreductase [Gammaproteobacteria bacterium]
MRSILILDTSPRREAVSRALSKRFCDAWRAKHPDASIVYRDVGGAPPEHLDDELIDALRRSPPELNERQQAAVTASDTMIAELDAADVIVVGAPMHNFTISGALRTWIDHVARPGKTFAYIKDKGIQGLLTDKPVIVLSTRGGDYGDGDPQNPNPADFQTGYLRHIFGFMGLRDVRIIAANGLDMGGDARKQGMTAAERAIDAAVDQL